MVTKAATAIETVRIRINIFSLAVNGTNMLMFSTILLPLKNEMLFTKVANEHPLASKSHNVCIRCII